MFVLCVCVWFSCFVLLCLRRCPVGLCPSCACSCCRCQILFVSCVLGWCLVACSGAVGALGAVLIVCIVRRAVLGVV